MDLAGVDELLTTTRSVRKRLDLERAVPPEVIEECLQLAVQAPSGGNLQGWRWLVVTDPELRRVVGDAYRKGMEATYGAAVSEEPPAEEAQGRRTRGLVSSAAFLTRNMHRVPVHVIPCVRAGVWGEGSVFASASLYASIFPAVWSFQLALRSRGLGSTLTTLHLRYWEPVHEALALPDDVIQTCLLPVAYTKGTKFHPADRRPASEVTYWNRWKQSRSM